ncbi:hypothetical protein ElyMa_003295700 [Elysia marginata]|uniref:Uncharacterized protein n=1 Tax=Elysia marginata TaxID=1093978 RepID=A0AAV4JA66_9GAST|nr:hypothetical protein ElyMa_003295700 [Elysia marginata]
MTFIVCSEYPAVCTATHQPVVNKLLMCGDVESNPGPPKTSRDTETNPTGPTRGKTGRTRQSTPSGSFVNTASPTQNVPSKPTESSNEPCIRDVMNAIGNLTSKFDNISKSMSDLNHSVKDLNSKYCTLQTQLQDATNSFRRLKTRIEI